METAKLSEMKFGWFLGDFQPSAYNTSVCEAAIKSYKKGDVESEHYHKIATEITVIQTGRVKMFSKEFIAGDIIIIYPFEKTSFEALEDTVTIVVKVPGAQNDKYLS